MKDGAHLKEWQAVTKAFLDHAFAVEPGLVILCPCSKCENKWLWAKEDIEEHQCIRGFMPNYLVWRAHGECGERVDQGVDLHEDHDRMDEMLNDLGIGVDRTSEGPGQLPPEQFYRLLAASDERLHNYTQSTLLQTLTRLMSIKSKHNISNIAYNDTVKLIDDILPENHKLPKNLYFAKKILASLGMKYEKIDVCPNNCIMFWEEDGTDKYVQVTNDEGGSVTTKVAAKQLRYMQPDSRFLWMYLCKETAMHMRWPKEGKRPNKDEDIMEHPVDNDAWKALTNFDPEFAKDPRSIRFDLSTDGFTPFNTNASPYSCWPVFIIPYNLPPELVNKDEYMFHALVIPGPEHPGPKLNMFMHPLFKDLKKLWRGVKAYDSYAKEEFTFRATYLWSVHDFMAYGDWSGWCVHGRLRCPICMNDSDAFKLKHGGKHDLRSSNTAFRKGVKITKGPPKRLIAKQIMAWHAQLKPGENGRFAGYGKKHNWTHKSIIWELPYVEALMLPHTIDPMHQERDVAKSIISTCFDVTDKSKDNIKARKDLALICDRPALELRVSNNEHESRPQADYCPKPEDWRQIFQWLKTIKFLDRAMRLT
ncbi:LOW QUALITY PROTEIN: hypothetical protein U9M48_036455 [Paspalum notatum var. saurae]|uniref:Transposase-associated domain-containing protein n=1 Tax=Paspalum notatum var. saurae TaxID=547442 RepID=A0AAQ3UH81_PASNO